MVKDLNNTRTRTIILVAASAALLLLALNQWALLAWIAPVPLLILGRTEKSKFSIPAPFLAYSGAYAANMFLSYGLNPLFLGGAIFVGCWFALPYLLDRLFWRAESPLTALLFPSAMTLLDWALANTNLFASNFSLANSQRHLLPVLQVLSLTGIWGLTFLIHWFASATATIWLAGIGRRRAMLSTGIPALLAITAVLTFGFLRLSHHDTTAQIKVGTVGTDSINASKVYLEAAYYRSGGNEDREKAKVDFEHNFDRLIEQSRHIASDGAELIVWPELSAPVVKTELESKLDKLRSLSAETGAAIVAGLAVTNSADGVPQLENRSILIEGGLKKWDYRKSQLVPGFEASLEIPGDGILPEGSIDKIRFTGAICRDLFYPQLMIQAAPIADAVVAPTWSFSGRGFQEDFDIFALRAIESGTTIILADHAGTQAIDPAGRTLNSFVYSHDNHQAVFNLPISKKTSYFSSLGPWVPISSLVFLLVALPLFAQRKYGDSKAKNLT